MVIKPVFQPEGDVIAENDAVDTAKAELNSLVE